MKLLFLTLLLGVVCAAQEDAEQSLSELSGKWRVAYIASSNSVIKTVQLGFSLVKLEIDDKRGTIEIDVCVELNGNWEKMHFWGRKKDENTYVVYFFGTNELRIKYASDNVLVLCVVNKFALGGETQFVGILVKANIEEEPLAVFNELIAKKNIEEKDIVNFIESEDCPSCTQDASTTSENSP